VNQEERESFLADVHVGILSIAVDGRGPVTTPIWYQYEPGGELVFTTQQKSKKIKLLRKAGRFSLCVQQEELPYKFVSVEGPIKSIEPADISIDIKPIAYRYLGQKLGDHFLKSLGEPEVVLRMVPERWSSGVYDIRLEQ